MTKAEIWEFVRTNEKFRDAIIDKAMELISGHFPDEEEENDLPLSPGKWYVGHTHTKTVYTKSGGMIADCEGSNAEADAKAIVALRGLLIASKVYFSRFNFYSSDCPERRAVHEALKAAGIDMEAGDGV